jgi:hypothetical protein
VRKTNSDPQRGAISPGTQDCCVDTVLRSQQHSQGQGEYDEGEDLATCGARSAQPSPVSPRPCRKITEAVGCCPLDGPNTCA